MTTRQAPTAAGERTTRVRFVVMAFLCVLAFLTYYDRQCIVRAQGEIQKSLGLSDEQLSIVFGAFSLAYALLEIPGGWMGDRWGTRFTLTRIVLAWSLFTALTGAATGFISLLTYRLLFGAGEAGAFPNMARVQSRWLPQAERSLAAGILWMCARWGAGFAPLIFGGMTVAAEGLQARAADSSWGAWFGSLESWRIAFVLSGLAGVVWCVAFYWWFRDEPAEKPSVGAAELRHIVANRAVGDGSHSADLGVWKRLFSSPSLWAMAAYYVCGSFAWSFFVSWMPRYMKDVQGVPFEKSEWSTALPLLCGGVACLVGGILSDMVVRRTGWRRLGRAMFPITGCTVAAGAMLALPHAQSDVSATALMCVAAAAFDFGQAASWATIIDMGGRRAGIAAGFINMVGQLGNVVQPYVGQVIFNSSGWNTLFAIYAAAYLGAMTMWLVINPTRTFYEDK